MDPFRVGKSDVSGVSVFHGLYPASRGTTVETPFQGSEFFPSPARANGYAPCRARLYFERFLLVSCWFAGLEMDRRIWGLFGTLVRRQMV